MRCKVYNLPVGKVGFLTALLALFSLASFAQSLTISGKVTEAGTLDALPGVNVLEKGTNNGTSTDIDGKYTLNVSGKDAILVFSFIGFAPQEVTVGNSSEISIELESGDNALEEVVVVGYAQLKKSDLTGSVASIDNKAITERNFTNPMEAVQGNIAGVQISSSTGRLGDGFDITIRGNNSLNDDSNPLYVVDGVPSDNIDFLNPQDIARIDVLKDASSTAIYGSRGSNGVVIVTTKSGSNVKSGINVTLDSYYGVKKVARLPQMMDAQKWWYYHQSAYLATTNLQDPMAITPEVLKSKVVGSSNPLLEQRAANNEWFDWYDLVLQDGNQHNTYLNFSGRGESGLGYNIGLGVQNETGNVQREALDKYSLKVGINHKLNDKVSYGLNTTFSLKNDQFGSDVAMREAFRLNPFLSPYDIDGVTLFPQPGKLRDENGQYLINKTSTYNPLLEIANSQDEVRKITGIGSAFVEYKPIQWLAFKTTFSPGFSNQRRGKAWGALTNVGSRNNNLPSSELRNAQNINYTWDNQFTINKTFKQDHNFTLLGLQSVYSTQSEGSTISARNQPFETEFYNLGSGDQSTYNIGSYFVKQTLASFALRANYSYKGKYLLTLSNRWDGSSLLSEANRWDNFPSAALAWNISQESFLANVPAISFLKLRLSYGFTGNNIIAPYSLTNVLDTQVYYDFLGSNANGWVASSLANNALGWEKTREGNFGIDFGFLKERISGSIDFYDRLSDGLLLERKLVLELGGLTINDNIGSVSNKGVELALTTRNIKSRDLSWTTNFTFTRNRNRIVSIYGTDADDIGNNWFIGESINSIYNYEFDGIWQANERDLAESYGQLEGQAKVVDQNNDGKITADDDRIILGNSDPTWTGSVFSTLNYKNFDFSFSVLSSVGSFVNSPFHANFTNTRDRGRQKLDIDWYIPENGAGVPAQFSNEYPQPRNMGTFWRNSGVGYYRDASFTKIKNITLGYTLAPQSAKSIGINGLRIYGNVLNPFVFTSYDGYDPEWADASFNVGRTASITYQLGLSVKF
ncbi:SusC/RagA family TonB-linked outer membrane protein [Jiulongibacter sp. NS-SX5]|uniref:SusC/RagA family TonB-linked outer membrane protein n=1 Tax=Jiulongibacter sp. NS-SX5 TaxID=3463854 RepID=UPI00405827DF